ncbi:MAG: FAD:protein FMN transferase [Thiomargarita sp.]|nr:FAD:protein FMN transferase [Thiomargarita sp.]
MSCPCEVLIAVKKRILAQRLVNLAAAEAWRIEQKFSRYINNNMMYHLNQGSGIPIRVDTEMVQLLNFAQQCYELSHGLFDITSGILRTAWVFDGGDHIPTQSQIERLLPYIGWDKVTWKPPYITLPKGMEFDFGGIGKEYAVDRTLMLLQQKSKADMLVNFGGDIQASGQRIWSVGIENPAHLDAAQKILKINKGALATSGDARRFLMKAGKRYGHVLNPKTGWPINTAPRSVTVASHTCTEAGMLATFALLQGDNADNFLKNQEVPYWILI